VEGGWSGLGAEGEKSMTGGRGETGEVVLSCEF
jgi:hypothetical protein